MNDNDIIKALECCKNTVAEDMCNDCPLSEQEDKTCITILCDKTLDLINRQKAEIERLQKEGLQLNKTFMDFVNVEKYEAIKEFWEKLKTEARLRNHTNYGKNELATAHNEGVIIARKHILVCGDNLVKEMTENDFKE